MRSSINKRIGNNTSDRGKGAEQKGMIAKETRREKRGGGKKRRKKGEEKKRKKKGEKIKVKQRAQPAFYPGLKFKNTYFDA